MPLKKGTPPQHPACMTVQQDARTCFKPGAQAHVVHVVQGHSGQQLRARQVGGQGGGIQRALHPEEAACRRRQRRQLPAPCRQIRQELRQVLVQIRQVLSQIRQVLVQIRQVLSQKLRHIPWFRGSARLRM